MVNNNNVQNVKFLRNGNVFTPSIDPVKTAREVALDAMEQQKENLADGTAILGRYKETDGFVKTLVGFAYISNDAKTLTVFDVDGAGADVDKKIRNGNIINIMTSMASRWMNMAEPSTPKPAVHMRKKQTRRIPRADHPVSTANAHIRRIGSRRR